MPANIGVTGTFPAYQVTVRGTLLEILDTAVDPERIGPRRPVGIASDTGAQLVYLDGDLWAGHLGIVADLQKSMTDSQSMFMTELRGIRETLTEKVDAFREEVAEMRTELAVHKASDEAKKPG